MSDKCNPHYKNLNEIQSFSEQRYATVQWAEQNCQNDEWLKQQVEHLSYLTPPAVRKRFNNGIEVDESKSWGYQVNSQNMISFSNAQQEEIIIDFNTLDMIDIDKSNCVFENYVGNDDVYHSKATVPQVINDNPDYSTAHKKADGSNSFWYVGYDKNKPYVAYPSWIKNNKNKNIPSIARAQTFKCINGGLLESVTLNIQTTGDLTSPWASPLYVQIWKTKKKHLERKKWDSRQNKAVSYSPKVYDDIAFPVGDINKPLAEATFNPDRTIPEWHTFVFDKKPELKQGESYAIVVFSPLAHPSHCPRIGGWGLNCRDAKYNNGCAFISEDNCRTWTRYGYMEVDNPYKYGRNTPQDFAFECKIVNPSSNYVEGEHYLYLNPIHANPIRNVKITSISNGNELSQSNAYLTFQVSSTGHENDWHNLDNNGNVNFNVDPLTGTYPTMCFIRAKMYADNGTVPYIEQMDITLNMDPAKEMYVRTDYYYPKVTPMLGANVWGRICTPFTVEPTVEGSVEIIRAKEGIENFKIITAKELEDFVYVNNQGDNESIFEGLDADKMCAQELTNPSAINILKQNNVYVKPYTYEKNGETITDLLSFTDGIQLNNSPAYPILRVVLQPEANEPIVSYSEWIDFVFDYDSNILKFHYDDSLNVLTDMPVGGLDVTYNPVFIQDLTQEEVGVRENDEGLILDYFKESFNISEVEVANRRVKLRVEPVDPIRQVLLNDEELLEDRDFRVDYTNNFELIFDVNNVDGESTRLSVGDVLTVVYTPNLTDAGICIGYRGRREDTSKQMCISSNYIEYKV